MRLPQDLAVEIERRAEEEERNVSNWLALQLKRLLRSDKREVADGR